MDVLEMGAKILAGNMPGGSVTADQAKSALSGLLGDGKGGIDLTGIAAGMQGGSLAGIAASWLGSGTNQSIDAGQLLGMFGNEKISQFASTLGADQDTALSGLSEALPRMMDQGSSGGSLLGSLGGKGNLAKLAGGLFK